MKKFLFAIIIYHSSIILAFSQTGTWTWMRGDSSGTGIGNYGVKGVPSPTNDPPGRYACGYWTDTAGNFWIYGGLSNVASPALWRSDLWKFDPVTNLWTWMHGSSQTNHVAKTINAVQGVYDPLNTPGYVGYGMFTWVTRNNHFWLFGGDSGKDLWQFNPAINQWAWMGLADTAYHGVKGIGDAATRPGRRSETSTAWTDSSDNLWLFGGFLAPNEFNDMWKYEVSSGIWTWMSGTKTGNHDGVYGTLGVPSVNNCPPGRSTNISWKEKDGNFWLSGGQQIYTSKHFQDVWRFNPNTLEWTWVRGPQGDYKLQVFTGANCDTSSSFLEGGVYENRPVWKYCEEVLINFAGNILWSYILPLKSWSRLTYVLPSYSRYGQKGVADPANSPPKRTGSASFMDRQRNLWVFSGEDFSFFSTRSTNDLWKFTLDTSCLITKFCEPVCLTDGIVTALRDTVCIDQPPVLHFSGAVQHIQWQYSIDGAVFSDLTGLTGEDCLDIPTQTSYYRVKSMDDNCPLITEAIRIVVDTTCQITGISEQWAVANGQLTVNSGLVGGVVEIFNLNGQIVFQSKISNLKSEILFPENGVYFIRVSSKKGSVVKKWVRW